MRSFFAFFKKELLERVRRGRALLLLLLFLMFGAMNTGGALMIPWLYDVFREDFLKLGLDVGSVTVSALDSWAQFFKNIPMALISFVLIEGGTFTREYGSGPLVLIVTKGLDRYKVLLSKASVLLASWTVGYWLCFVTTYLLNMIFWDNGVAESLLPAAIMWWLFGVFVVALVVLFSVVASNYGIVMLMTMGAVLVCYLVSIIPPISHAVPTALMNGLTLVMGTEVIGDYAWAIGISAALSVAFVVASVPIFNKKQI